MITGWTLFFIVVGVTAISAKVMDIIIWLDTPKGARK